MSKQIKTYEIWCEGALANGVDFKAHKMGEATGISFYEAVKEWSKTYIGKAEISFNRNGPNTIDHWGCQLFDNQKDAMKQFG